MTGLPFRGTPAPMVRGLRAGLVITLICLSARAEAGWTQPRGESYAKLWVRTLVGDGVFVDGRDIARLPDTYQDHQLNAYLELGLTDEVTFTLQGTVLGYARYQNEDDFYTGVLLFGARHALLRGDFKLAVETRIGGSGGAKVLGQGSFGAVPYTLQPAIETFIFDAELRSGFAFGDGFWTSANLGTRLFGTGTLDPAPFGFLQLGWKADWGLALDVHFNGYCSINEITNINVYGAGNTRYLGFGLAVGYWFTDGFAISATLEGAFYAEANAATPSFMLGVEFD